MHRRSDRDKYEKLSRPRKILLWCFVFVSSSYMLYYIKAVFPKALRITPHSKPSIDSEFAIIWYFIVPFLAIVLLFVILDSHFKRRERRELDERVRGTAGKMLTPEYFLDHRRTLKESDFNGVYILHNTTKDLYYVGQGVRVYGRLSQHFMGHGNADVYADWKYGDRFEIKVIPLTGSGYQSLNDLERDAIESYDAFERGYNRTRGNAR